MRRLVLFSLGVLPLFGLARHAPPASATVPLDASTNCAIVQLGFVKPDGAVRMARFLVDTGGGGFILTESLANELGLRRTGPAMTEGEGTFAPLEPPTVRLGTMPIDLAGVSPFASVGTKRFGTRDDAEGLVPGRLLRKYYVIFDYPAGTFTMAAPGSVKPLGERVPAPIGRTGFPRIELTIAGETNGFLLDTGATYTMISQAVLERWGKAQPAWPRVTGAIGIANMMGGQMEATATMLRLEEAVWGRARVEQVVAVSRPVGTFENYMSGMMTSPVVGAIGGNILKQFRVEIDYANGVVYLQKSGATEAHDTDTVGLTLQATADGVVTIAAVAPAAAPGVIDALRAGDRLRQIDGRDADGLTLSALQRALAGKPGDTKTLVIERSGQRLTVKAVVARIL